MQVIVTGPLIGVHEMHGRMHPIITILLAHDPLSSLAYPMITHGPPVAGNLPTKNLYCPSNSQQDPVQLIID